MTSHAVATVTNPEPSEPSYESTLLRSPDRESELSGFCTSCGVLASGSDDTERGRSSYNAGLRRAMATYINSPLMEQLSMELTVNRVALQAMSGAAQQRERLISHWKAEAQWWRDEHDKVHAAYCAFVKEIARRFPK